MSINLIKDVFINISASITYSILIQFVLFFILLQLVKIYWKQKRLYRHYEKLNGPKPLPIIGNALMFVGSTKIILDTAMNVCSRWESPIRLWFGSQLVLILTKPQDLQVILNHQNIEKFYKPLGELLGKGLITAPVRMWRVHRKMINPSFNPKILNTFIDVFQKNANILVDKLKKYENGEIFDASHYLLPLTLDNVCETTTGVPVNAQGGHSIYFKYFVWACHLIVRKTVQPFLYYNLLYKLTPTAYLERKRMEYLKKFNSNIIKEKCKQYENRSKTEEKTEVVEQNVNSNDNDDDDIVLPKRKQMLEMLIENTDLTNQQLVDEVITMTSAGSDTSASALNFCLMMLAIHQDIQQKVYDEIMDIFGESDRGATVDDVANLKYTEMVLKETMRRYPPVSFITRRTKEPIKLETCTVPKNCILILSIYHVHNDPNLWPEPNHFDPERFNPNYQKERHPYSFIPFSAGPRNCIGYKYAMIAMKVIIATILRKYKISTNLTPEQIKLVLRITLHSENGYPIKLTPRCTN